MSKSLANNLQVEACCAAEVLEHCYTFTWDLCDHGPRQEGDLGSMLPTVVSNATDVRGDANRMMGIEDILLIFLRCEIYIVGMKQHKSHQATHVNSLSCEDKLSS